MTFTNHEFFSIAALLVVQMGAFLFWGGRTYQMLQVLQRGMTDHEQRLRRLEQGAVIEN